MASYHCLNEIGLWGERGEVKHLSTRRKRYSVSSGERKRRRLNQMRVRGGGRCVFGVVGPCWIFLPGGRVVCCWELNSLGWLTVERESRVGGLVMVCVDVVPE